MGQIKRLFVKRLSLPIMCIFLIFMLLKPNSLNWKPVVGDNELLKILHTLQKAQAQNKILLIQTGNSSFDESAEKLHNIRNEMFAEDKTRKETRKWFDARPGANFSKMAVYKHPLFPGYVIENPELCKGGNVDMLLYLHSAVEHRESRRMIRASWGSPRTFSNINVKLLFILGIPSDNLAQNQIETEFATYGDILQGNFSDTFKNLTYKAITMLAWVNTHCLNVRYIIKIDDDMFVDIYRVVSEFIPKLASKKLTIACDVKTDMVVPRDPRIKWYVNEALLPGRTKWPQFCSGYFAVFTGETVPVLYEASFGINQFIPIDDAYLFGLLVERNVTLKYINIHDQISVNERPDPDKEINVNSKFEFISFRVKSPSDHTKLWTLRSTKLSAWEQAHSSYYNVFRDSKERTVLVV